MQTAISVLTQAVSNKDDIKRYADCLISDVKNGYISALDTMVIIKKSIHCFDQVAKAIDEQYTDEGLQYAGQVYQDFAIEKAALGVKYDYSACNDEVYNNLVAQKKQLDTMIKAREAMLKTGVNPETGEEFPKPIRTGKEGIKMTLK